MDRKIIRYFKERDAVLGILADCYTGLELVPSKDRFSDLARSIISQQLSEKAGTTIWNRFTVLFPGRKPQPESVLRMPTESIRATGASYSKAAYLHNVGEWFLTNPGKVNSLPSMPDADVVRELTSIKGIGQWTAEMFLIFSLGREDIFSFGDAGLARAVSAIYPMKRKMTVTGLKTITRVWKPYRSYASLLLWKSLE